MTLQEEIDRQVKAGMCRRGETATGCLLADGSEAACQTIRECAPSQHFEYALPGVTPNVNIWTMDPVRGWVWSGATSTTPVTQPGMGIDPLTGQVGPVVNYGAILPPPTNGLPVITQAPPVNRAPATDGSQAIGTPVAPAYGQNLGENIQRYLMAAYGTYVVSQSQFCIAYQRFTGFACDFSASINGVKESREWLSMLQREQDDRVSVVSNRPTPGAGAGPGSGIVVTRPGGSTVTPPPPSGGFEFTPMMAVLVVGLILVMKR